MTVLKSRVTIPLGISSECYKVSFYKDNQVFLGRRIFLVCRSLFLSNKGNNQNVGMIKAQYLNTLYNLVQIRGHVSDDDELMMVCYCVESGRKKWKVVI